MAKKANAFPAKRFFVEMLIRDIELSDALLDLLDNCVDGATRSLIQQGKELNIDKPYAGFYAHMNFDSKVFSLKDNCGGISLDLAEKYAFKLGRSDQLRDADAPTVGIYGIGMKRALFKLGRSATVTSRTDDEKFRLKITPEWLESDDDWEFDLNEDIEQPEEVGTEIKVDSLRENVSLLFDRNNEFEQNFRSVVISHYSYLIEKGFEVSINGKVISANRLELSMDPLALERKTGIAPYVFESEQDGVKIRLVIGLYRPIPSADEEDAEIQGRNSSERAGWTVICNDRVVLYADKSRVTGWGDAGIPKYHTQFISIAGIVTFHSTDPSKLPITTTKRGVDGNSELYLMVKQYMREGLKIFTDFTNKWKGATKQLQESQAGTKSFKAETIEVMVPRERWSKARDGSGRYFKPMLPVPHEEDPLKQIKFSRSVSEISKVSNFLFGHANGAPGDVGAKCFDEILKKV